MGLTFSPVSLMVWMTACLPASMTETSDPFSEVTYARLPSGENNVKFTAWLRSFVPVDHLQVICNGQVTRDLKVSSDGSTADVESTIPISRSGWCLLRAWSEKAEHPVLDLYPYATTSPIYVTVAGSKPKPSEDAAYFIAWIDRLIEDAKSNHDWNTDEEKTAVLGLLASARKIYEEMRE